MSFFKPLLLVAFVCQVIYLIITAKDSVEVDFGGVSLKNESKSDEAHLFPSPLYRSSGTNESGHCFYYRATNGVGHRLARLSSVFHLAVALSSTNSLRISHIKTDWKNCEPHEPFPANTYKSLIWEMLFGPENIPVPTDMKYKDLDWCSKSAHNKYTSVDEKQVFIFNNEAPGYHKQSAVSREGLLRDDIKSKVQTDAYFYSYLQTRFRLSHDLEFRKFFARFNFNDYFVIGLHLRFGSSNDRDFKNKNREVLDQQTYCRNITRLIHQIIQDKRLVQDKPFMLFLATDNQDAVNYLNQTIHDQHVPVTLATYYQPDQLKFNGMSFYNETNEKTYDYSVCMDNWRNSMMDMVLLSMSDLLVAGMYSSFLQSMPISLVFNRAPFYSTNISSYDLNSTLPFPVYCEVSHVGNAATCHSSYKSAQNASFTIENQTTFFYGVQSSSWSIHSRHYTEVLVPVDYNEVCSRFPTLC